MLVASPAAASSLDFRSPGQFSGSWTGSHDATWALLVFKDETTTNLNAQSTEDAALWNETLVWPLRAHYFNADARAGAYNESGAQPIEGPFNLQATFAGRSSLYIFAESIDLNVHDAHGILSVKKAEDTLAPYYRPDDDELYQIHGQEFGDSVVVSATASSRAQGAAFSLAAKGASFAEWYNADVKCHRASACPTGGGPQVQELPSAPGYTFTSERHTYEGLKGQGIAIHGSGIVEYVVFGSPRMTLGIAGSVRLPLATSTTTCADCVLPANQTFQATGNITLANLEASADGLRADLGGDLDTATFDEVSVDPGTIFGARVAVIGTVAVGGGLGLAKLIKWAFPALFTRYKEEGPLTNERRRRLYEYIKLHPGAHFREALRGADVPAGSGRHHITKLVQAGLVVERRHRNSVCLFENDKRFAGSWQDLAALRDSDQRLLHDWLQTHPGSVQKAIVAAFLESHGWARSATQGKLQRLVRDGVVDVRFHGQFKLYSASKPATVAVAPMVVATTA